jgi:hypothetical protein
MKGMKILEEKKILEEICLVEESNEGGGKCRSRTYWGVNNGI